MKQPITENEEFKKNIEGEAENFANITKSLKAVYEKGAKDAQTILQSEHDKEMIEFADWKLKNIAGGSLRAYGDNFVGYLWQIDTVPVNSTDLYKIFRKEQGNE
jgi:hypothetical protein